MQYSKEQYGTLDRKQMGSIPREDWKFWVGPLSFPRFTGDSEAGGSGISWETLALANLAETGFGISDRRA